MTTILIHLCDKSRKFHIPRFAFSMTHLHFTAHGSQLIAHGSLLIAHAPMLTAHCSSLKAKQPHRPLPQSIEFFHFFVQKRIDVFCVNERCVQIAVAQEFACCRERDADGNACCCKRVAGQMTMQILAHS